jgi:heat shock protein HtpX
MKRIALFVLTNIAVLAVITITVRLLGLDQAMQQEGLALGPLLAFSAVVGFAGSIISLLMSKPMAKWSTGAKVIDG